MKNIFFLTFIFLTQGLIAQENIKKDIICSGKWHLEYLSFDGIKDVLKPKQQLKSWVIFHSDGKHEVMEMGEVYIGKWEYIPEKGIIKTTDRDGVVDQNIIEINENTLVVSVKEQYAEIVMGLIKL